MMKAEELRIGNLVELAGKEHEVHWQTLKGLSDPERKDLEHLIKPIPLTPEILEKCGFERNSESGKRFMYDYVGMLQWRPYKIFFSKKRGSIFKINAIGKFIKIAELKYLHELQNIFFALKSEELKVNLTEPQLT